jgi:IMP dehydrogenase
MVGNEDIKVAQGVVGTVIDRGSLVDFLPYLENGLKHAYQDIGFKNINELHDGMVNGKLRMQIRSFSSIKEGDVHDLYQYEKHIL